MAPVYDRKLGEVGGPEAENSQGPPATETHFSQKRDMNLEKPSLLSLLAEIKYRDMIILAHTGLFSSSAGGLQLLVPVPPSPVHVVMSPP